MAKVGTAGAGTVRFFHNRINRGILVATGLLCEVNHVVENVWDGLRHPVGTAATFIG
jgi:hypothetical protein